jgi:hypothetical protein
MAQFYDYIISNELLFLLVNFKTHVHQWLIPVTLATWEAEIRRTKVPSQMGQRVCKTLSQKNPSQKRAGGVTQGIGLEFKSQYKKLSCKIFTS